LKRTLLALSLLLLAFGQVNAAESAKVRIDLHFNDDLYHFQKSSYVYQTPYAVPREDVLIEIILTQGSSRYRLNDSTFQWTPGWPAGFSFYIWSDSSESFKQSVTADNQWQDLVWCHTIDKPMWRYDRLVNWPDNNRWDASQFLFHFTAPDLGKDYKLYFQPVFFDSLTGLSEFAAAGCKLGVHHVSAHEDSVRLLQSAYRYHALIGDTTLALQLADSLIRYGSDFKEDVDFAAGLARAQNNLPKEFRFVKYNRSKRIFGLDNVIDRMIAAGMAETDQVKSSIYSAAERLSVVDSLDRAVRQYYPPMHFDSARWCSWRDSVRFLMRAPMSNRRFWDIFEYGLVPIPDSARNHMRPWDEPVGLRGAFQDPRIWLVRAPSEISMGFTIDCGWSMPPPDIRWNDEFAWIGVQTLKTPRAQDSLLATLQKAKTARGIFLDFRECRDFPSIDTLFALLGSFTRETLPGVRISSRDSDGQWRDSPHNLMRNSVDPYTGPLVLWPPARGERAAAVAHAFQSRPYTKVILWDSAAVAIPTMSSRVVPLPLKAKIWIPTEAIRTHDGKPLRDILDSHMADEPLQTEMKSTFKSAWEPYSVWEMRIWDDLDKLAEQQAIQKEHDKHKIISGQLRTE
jgi:hypothetical protein